MKARSDAGVGFVVTGLMDPMLSVAIAAARAAGEVIRRASRDRNQLEIRAKRPNDYVTQVDIASEKVIVDTVLAAFPGHAVRGEESQQPHGNSGSDHVWIVDPIDGTNNFIHGYPMYSVSIALAVAGRIEHGVVLDVERDQVFHASRGRGAFCGARRLQLANRNTLQQALVGTSCPFRPGPDFARSMQMLGDVMAQVAGIRRSGSAALDLAWLAAGYSDAFFDRGLKAWDVAAGSLLVSEAGGQVGDFSGRPDFLETQECVAGNPELFRALVAIVRPYGRAEGGPAAGTAPIAPAP